MLIMRMGDNLRDVSAESRAVFPEERGCSRPVFLQSQFLLLIFGPFIGLRINHGGVFEPVVNAAADVIVLGVGDQINC